jgi:hypothetical protein
MNELNGPGEIIPGRDGDTSHSGAPNVRDYAENVRRV